MLFLILTGCLVAHTDAGVLGAFDAKNPHAEPVVDVGVGVGAGVHVDLDARFRASAQEAEFVLAPEVGSYFGNRRTFGAWGVGMTMIGGGVRQGRTTVLIGGPHVELLGLTRITDVAKLQDPYADMYLRYGVRGGADLRATGGLPTPWASAFIGIEYMYNVSRRDIPKIPPAATRYQD